MTSSNGPSESLIVVVLKHVVQSIWMAYKTWPAHHIILVISPRRRGVISVSIGGRESGGTNEVTIQIVIIVVFRISTTIVVAKGIIISVDFGFFIIVIDDGVVGFAFGCRIRPSGEGTVTICSKMKKKMMIVAFEIMINVVSGIVLVVVIVVIVNLVVVRIIINVVFGIAIVIVVVVVVFGIVIAVVVIVAIVTCEGPTLSCLILCPAVGIMIVGVDKAKGPIISGTRGLDTAVGILIIVL